MQMFMRIGMVQLQAGGRKGGELGTDLRRQLPSDLWQQEIAHPAPPEIRSKTPLFIDQIRHLLRRQQRRAVHQGKMQPYTQAGQRPGTGDGIRGGRSGDHEASGGQHTVTVC